ncbi:MULTISPECIES: hypothetical protein [Streptomyces]|uniref:Uncharacterized protein n=1 Tax=Streptomyces griseiscabiei TaxID=2993540 RepID=A0ABU4LJX3_9ACTN|nr:MULTISPECIES: hypothetical protein [Streptomyces]MBP5866094.1 hypothetical protein [Streptomyces sp. LBUM 1484]MBP5880768.1 hypothetical protein [Streptomyces sp. LBUM 1477]MBZ3908834.1 hypothetical protein [Streptomyces griseiscabiei]MDX2567517.1 hypothetical protein [Streptomyces scabiei]MDX2916109.1 hypothetical protein [Streptomyces griseiscabiei]
MARTFHWTAQVSDGKHHDGECAGTVTANSEAEARTAIADWVSAEGARKGSRRPWTATNIQLS